VHIEYTRNHAQVVTQDKYSFRFRLYKGEDEKMRVRKGKTVKDSEVIT